MIKTTPRERVKEYFDSPNLSQSYLKQLAKGFNTFLASQLDEQSLYYEEKGHFLIGSAVDAILTGNVGDFENEFYISQLEKKPSDVEMSIINKVFDDVSQFILGNISDNLSEMQLLSNYPEFIEDSITAHNWQDRWKMDTKVAKIIEIGTVYFEDLKNSYGKKVLSASQYEIISEIITSLTTNPRTAYLFDRESEHWNGENIDIYYQLPLYFFSETENPIPCKALLDILIVVKDENGYVKEMHPIDLKTKAGYTFDFPGSVRSFRYDFQSAWYTDALLNRATLFPEGFPPLRSDVVVMPFTFVVESSTNPGNPLLFNVSESLLEVGRNGIRDQFTGKVKVKGYYDLLKEYDYYSSTGWTEQYVVAVNDGVLDIDWEGIKEAYVY